MENVSIRPIPGIENYFAGDDGRIYKKSRRGYLQLQGCDNYGYRLVKIIRQGRYFTVRAHRLVYEAWKGPIQEGYEIDHINGDKSDNRPCNLDLVTHSENIKRAARAGCFDCDSVRVIPDGLEEFHQEFYSTNECIRTLGLQHHRAMIFEHLRKHTCYHDDELGITIKYKLRRPCETKARNLRYVNLKQTPS